MEDRLREWLDEFKSKLMENELFLELAVESNNGEP